MLRTLAYTLYSLLLFSISGHCAIGHADEVNSLDKRQTAPTTQTNYTAITGVQNNGVQPRLEIRQMYNTKPNQWNLLMLGMQMFQNQVQTGQFSYYQIAGIHGVPNVPWDGVTHNPASGGAVGYCTHSSVLFPAWHRPYLALFEQILYDNVQAIVASFPNGTLKDTYANAASTFRLPYWDWAAAPASGLPTFPLIISSQYATVITPSGQQTILNPLFRYTFHPLVPSDMLYQPWAHWVVTFRWPTNNGSNTSTTATSQNNLAQSAIETSRLSRRDSVYNLFTLCSDYLEFSNDAASSSTTGCATSLEAIHNQIHSLVGGSNNGHMTWLWWGAFDPIFFLHHANVDRLFALWQAIYPNNYGASQVAPGNTYTIAQGSVQDADSPLTPFHASADGTSWTTNSVRNHTIFGYTYPELLNGTNSTAVMGIINSLYGPNATATAGSVPVSKRDVNENLVQGAHGPFNVGSIIAKQNVEYIANVAYPRWALNGSYSIYLFMGPPVQDTASAYPFESNLIGSVNVLANPGMSMNKLISSASVPLTRSLALQVGGRLLKSLENIFVVPFLQKALTWRIATASGQVVPSAQLPGFEVSVVSAEYTPASSPNGFPKFKPFNVLPDITHGKAGGFNVRSLATCES